MRILYIKPKLFLDQCKTCHKILQINFVKSLMCMCGFCMAIAHVRENFMIVSLVTVTNLSSIHSIRKKDNKIKNVVCTQTLIT